MAVDGIAEGIADHEDDDLAARHAVAHLRHQLVAEPHAAVDVQPVGHLGGQEDALAQRLGNLLRAIVAAPVVREEDGALEHLLDLDVGVARAAIEHALGVGTGRSEVQHAVVCKYRHACVSVGRVVCVCVCGKLCSHVCMDVCVRMCV